MTDIDLTARLFQEGDTSVAHTPELGSPRQLPQFFIRMLTGPGDVVLDIFAGSNTAGMVAEEEGRRWLAFELSLEYLAASSLRFFDCDSAPELMKTTHERILSGESVDLSALRNQTVMTL